MKFLLSVQEPEEKEEKKEGLSPLPGDVGAAFSGAYGGAIPKPVSLQCRVHYTNIVLLLSDSQSKLNNLIGITTYGQHEEFQLNHDSFF